ncbi:GntR family transcriptional regulator [Sphingobium sp.]|uniref:GntR family transcriptional regulator n=1 Tax=Sphingobium sp. TaxID=1912891 RepID=UPI0028BF5283|nr:GntR family transcriptional regulator [Sphingobium sp.]
MVKNLSSKLPKWYQLAQMLRTDIVSGRMKAGERIDAEIRLAEQYGISVVPVRQALRALEQEGLVVRHRGSGTYVSDTPRSSKQAITSLETLYSREFTKPAAILERGTVAMPEQFRAAFVGIDTLAFVRRLAYRGGKPWSYGVLYFAPIYAGKLTDRLLERFPTYRLLQELYGVELIRSHFEARAVAAGSEIAGFLDIDPFSPALSLSCVTYDRNDVAVGAFIVTFPGDPFTFSFETSHELL